MSMKKTYIYLDTSVIGGYYDPEFAEASQTLFSIIENGELIPVISNVTVEEIEGAPDTIKQLLKRLLPVSKYYDANEEVVLLARAYLDRKIISENYFDDCLHIAIATVFNVDLLVSWNFKHIVNFKKIPQFNAVNIESGYKPISIYSPLEVIQNE